MCKECVQAVWLPVAVPWKSSYLYINCVLHLGSLGGYVRQALVVWYHLTYGMVWYHTGGNVKTSGVVGGARNHHYHY